MSTSKKLLISISVILLIGALAATYALIHTGKPLQEREIAFPDVMSQSEVQHFLAPDFTIIKNMKALPRPVLEAYTEQGGSRLVMANPGEKFNATDVIYDSSVPRKRLILAGVSQGNYFIQYEQGGIAHSYLLALFELNSTKLEPLWRGYCGPAKTLEDLRAEVVKGHCSTPGW